MVMLEPAARLGEADRWPCGIIFSSAKRPETAYLHSASHWGQIVRSVVGGEVTLATVMLGDGSKDSVPHVDATFLFSLDSHLAERRGKYSLGNSRIVQHSDFPASVSSLGIHLGQVFESKVRASDVCECMPETFHFSYLVSYSRKRLGICC